MITIHELPALRSLLFFLAGIFLFNYYSPDLTSTLWLSSAVTVLLIMQFRLKPAFAHRYLTGLLHGISFFMLAGIVIGLRNEALHQDHLIHYRHEGKEVEIRATLTQDGVQGRTMSVIGQTTAIKLKDQPWRSCRGQIKLYLQDSLPPDQVLPGTRIIARLRLQHFNPPENPLEFDYGRYMARKQIFHSGYVPTGALEITGSVTNLSRIASICRNAIIERIRSHLGHNEVADISMALLLGKRDYIDESTNESFINTGAVHLLAVSGMHVILIYQNILILLGLFFSRQVLKRSIAVRLLILALIWAYALLAGASPSIIRATIMLSLLITGEMLRRDVLSLNTLCACALLMLMADPLTAWDVGFQLSFFAVAGIILIKPWLDKIVSSERRWFQSIRDLLTVTLAAQLGTLPLVLFYFHQFPIYFILSGLIAVVISDWSIKIGALTLLLGLVPFGLDQLMSKLWYLLTDLLLNVINGINRLPSPVIDQLYFSGWMLLISLAPVSYTHLTLPTKRIV